MEVPSDTDLPQETRKISNKQLDFTPKGIEKEETKLQNQQNESNNEDQKQRLKKKQTARQVLSVPNRGRN